MITSNHFDTPEYRRLEVMYYQQKRREQLVEYLQSMWLNLELVITETHFAQEVSIIVDGIKVSVVKIQRYDYMTEIDIIKLIVKTMNDLKRQKRKAIMEHLLNIERYTT